MHAWWKTWKSANAIQKSISLIRVFLLWNVENNPRRITRNSSAETFCANVYEGKCHRTRATPFDVWAVARAIASSYSRTKRLILVFALLIQKDTRSCVSHRDKPPLRRHLNRDRCRVLSVHCENTVNTL